jgi:hypothetical protein
VHEGEHQRRDGDGEQRPAAGNQQAVQGLAEEGLLGHRGGQAEEHRDRVGGRGRDRPHGQHHGGDRQQAHPEHRRPGQRAGRDGAAHSPRPSRSA